MSSTNVLRTRGSALIETALLLPFLILLLMGTLEIARFAYTYYALDKMMYAVARYAGTQQGVNFCDSADATVIAAKNFGLTGTADASTAPIITSLTADQIEVRIEQIDSAGGLNQCACSVPGCDTANGGTSPDFIVVSIPDGYQVTPHIPLVAMDPILLRPVVRVPYGGT